MQKNAPDHFDEHLIDRHEVAKEEGGTTIYPVVKGVESIVAFANLGVITFHVPPSTIDDPFHPDWIIWDLDPPAGRSDLAREAARAMRAILDDLGMPTALMTSGSNGYHLRARLDGSTDMSTAAVVARESSALGEAAHGDLLTLAFRKKDRGERVFVDWLRNAPYSTSVVPWSLRARTGAPAAVPIGWEELDEVDPAGIHLDEVSSRIPLDVWAGLNVLDLGDIAPIVSESVDAAGIELEPFDRFRSR
jgi:bifunctional non-homologous end joining protein LigD